jgi:hypothetical protein
VALLKREGLSPQEIKARVVSTAEERDELDDLVWSRGILSPFRALAIYQDVIDEEVGGTYRVSIGHVHDAPTLLTVCEKPVPVPRLRKLTIRPRAGGTQLIARTWVMESNQDRPELMNRSQPCPITGTDSTSVNLKFEDVDTGKIREIPVSTLREWIPPLWGR